ncbi:MAG: PilW family protein [Deltaproteobacteria bacterium]|nr:PilW family protein [Deltaproteobacteria bacterium]
MQKSLRKRVQGSESNSLISDPRPLIPDPCNKGFSLVELLIAMVIASVVGLAGISIFSSSNWSYKTQEDVTEAQQNVRVATDRLTKDIRMAGYGLPDPPFSLSFTGLPTTFVGQSGGNITLTSPITVTTSGGAGAPDSLTILGIGYEVGTLDTTTAVVNCVNGIQANISGANCIRLSATASVPAADTIDRFFPGGAFNSNRMHISLGGAKYIALAAAGQTGQATRTLALGSPSTLDRDYPDGTSVYIVQAVQYTIVSDTSIAGCSSSNPCLISLDATGLRGMNGGAPSRQLLAENIEDIQFAYGIDANPRDKKIDDTDGDGSFEGLDYIFAEAGDTLSDPSSIIVVRATVVGRTRNTDIKGQTGFKAQCFEDRPVDAGTTNCTGAASDGYRRRILTKVIKIRNPKTGA